jgi:hypothetical protein
MLAQKEELIDEYVFRYPILVGSSLFHKMTSMRDFVIGEFSICLLMMTAFFTGNILSIFYFALAAYFSRNIYIFNRLEKCHNAELSETKQDCNALLAQCCRFLRVWKFMIGLLVFSMVYKYLYLLIMIDMPNFYNYINYPWDSWSFGCDPAYRNTFGEFANFRNKSDYVKCIDEWKKWFVISSDSKFESAVSIFWDFFTFFSMVLT